MKYNTTRLREIRKDRDLSQSDIAKVLHTSQVQYSRYELGIRILPVDKLMKLAEYYNTSMDYLMAITDVRTPYPKTKIR